MSNFLIFALVLFGAMPMVTLLGFIFRLLADNALPGTDDEEMGYLRYTFFAGLVFLYIILPFVVAVAFWFWLLSKTALHELVAFEISLVLGLVSGGLLHILLGNVLCWFKGDELEQPEAIQMGDDNAPSAINFCDCHLDLPKILP